MKQEPRINQFTLYATEKPNNMKTLRCPDEFAAPDVDDPIRVFPEFLNIINIVFFRPLFDHLSQRNLNVSPTKLEAICE